MGWCLDSGKREVLVRNLSHEIIVRSIAKLVDIQIFIADHLLSSRLYNYDCPTTL